MEKPIVTDNKGKTYTIEKGGTLQPTTKPSGGIIGAGVDATTNVVKTVVTSGLPKSGPKSGGKK